MISGETVHQLSQHVRGDQVTLLLLEENQEGQFLSKTEYG